MAKTNIATFLDSSQAHKLTALLNYEAVRAPDETVRVLFELNPMATGGYGVEVDLSPDDAALAKKQLKIVSHAGRAVDDTLRLAVDAPSPVPEKVHAYATIIGHQDFAARDVDTLKNTAAHVHDFAEGLITELGRTTALERLGAGQLRSRTPSFDSHGR